MDFRVYAARFDEHARYGEVSRFADVEERGQAYPLLKLVTPGVRELLITSGFHGEEPAGPLTLLRHMGELAAHAREVDVSLRVYPCINPSGFEGGHRYNASDEIYNNDFLRYEVAPGEWADELRWDEPFLSWKVQDGGPKETRALIKELEAHGTPVAALDIHQDNYLAESCCYAYVFGDRAPYLPMLADSARHAPVAVSTQVDQGVHTDEHGLIDLRDGSVSDYLDRRGARHVGVLETTTRMPVAAADAINLVWLHGFIDLASRS